jgi:hypothetical protein
MTRKYVAKQEIKGGCGVAVDCCSKRLAYCAFQIHTCSSRSYLYCMSHAVQLEYLATWPPVLPGIPGYSGTEALKFETGRSGHRAAH